MIIWGNEVVKKLKNNTGESLIAEKMGKLLYYELEKELKFKSGMIILNSVNDFPPFRNSASTCSFWNLS